MFITVLSVVVLVCLLTFFASAILDSEFRSYCPDDSSWQDVCCLIIGLPLIYVMSWLQRIEEFDQPLFESVLESLPPGTRVSFVLDDEDDPDFDENDLGTWPTIGAVARAEFVGYRPLEDSDAPSAEEVNLRREMMRVPLNDETSPFQVAFRDELLAAAEREAKDGPRTDWEHMAHDMLFPPTEDEVFGPVPEHEQEQAFNGY